jgi:hypothetical protein
MTDEEYTVVQTQVILIANVVKTMALEDFLARIDQAHTIAPLADPTLYQRAAGRLCDIETLARQLLPLKSAVLEIYERDRRNAGGGAVAP